MARVKIEIIDSGTDIVIRSSSRRNDDIEPYPTLAEATAIKMIELLQQDLNKHGAECKHEH